MPLEWLVEQERIKRLNKEFSDWLEKKFPNGDIVSVRKHNIASLKKQFLKERDDLSSL